MSCNIHLIVQVKKAGRWDTQQHAEEGETTALYPFWQNYDAFAMLADVRNGLNFLPFRVVIDTGDGFTPIAAPRGLPPDLRSDGDVDPQDEEEDDVTITTSAGEEVWLGQHSFSYFSVSELPSLDADYWNQATRGRGWVRFEDRKQMLAQNARQPQSWGATIEGPDIQHISIQLMDKMVELGQDTYGKSYYAVLEWPVVYKDRAGQLYNELIPYLNKLAAEDDVQEVRIVFGFDN